jgi:hypothetical protein
MKALLPILLLSTACFNESAPISSWVSLEGQRWSASAFVADARVNSSLTITITREADPTECSYKSFDAVEIGLQVGDREAQEDLAPLDVEPPLSGWVSYSDHDQNTHYAVSGHMWPGKTVWEYDAEVGVNVIVQVDGEIDVVLPDGRSLTGAFSATPCERTEQ